MKIYCKLNDAFWSTTETLFVKWGKRILSRNTNVPDDQFLNYLDTQGWRRLQACPNEQQSEAFGILNFTVMTKKAFTAYIEGFIKRINEEPVPDPNVKSYSEWNDIGRRVNKGAKAEKVVKGIAYFHLSQTYNPTQNIQYTTFPYITEDEPMPH